jgi:hypothetical protein
VDGVIWSAAPPALPYSLRLFRFTSKEREGGAVFSSFSILYRISLFPFPFAVVCVFTFFFPKICVGLCSVIPMRCGVTTCPLFSFPFLKSFLRSASPLDSLIAPRKETPARSPLSISYRIVLYYNSPSNKLTNQPSLRNLDGRYSAVYIFERSESGTYSSTVMKAHNKHPRSSGHRL